MHATASAPIGHPNDPIRITAPEKSNVNRSKRQTFRSNQHKFFKHSGYTISNNFNITKTFAKSAEKAKHNREEYVKIKSEMIQIKEIFRLLKDRYFELESKKIQKSINDIRTQPDTNLFPFFQAKRSSFDRKLNRIDFMISQNKKLFCDSIKQQKNCMQYYGISRNGHEINFYSSTINNIKDAYYRLYTNTLWNRYNTNNHSFVNKYVKLPLFDNNLLLSDIQEDVEMFKTMLLNSKVSPVGTTQPKPLNEIKNNNNFQNINNICNSSEININCNGFNDTSVILSTEINGIVYCKGDPVRVLKNNIVECIGRLLSISDSKLLIKGTQSRMRLDIQEIRDKKIEIELVTSL
ncbi:MAG: hypothetical protein MHPSP_000097 [Paramarteilia canceri]